MKSFVKRFAVLAFFGLTFVACKKDYTCFCTLDGAPSSSFQYNGVEESAAEASCVADEFLLQQDNPTGVIDCSID